MVIDFGWGYFGVGGRALLLLQFTAPSAPPAGLLIPPVSFPAPSPCLLLGGVQFSQGEEEEREPPGASGLWHLCVLPVGFLVVVVVTPGVLV